MWGWQGPDWERDGGEVRLVAEQGSLSLTFLQATLFCCLSVQFLSQCPLFSVLSLFPPLPLFAWIMLMCVQERRALTGLEGKSGNPARFLTSVQSPLSMMRQLYHFLGQSWITLIDIRWWLMQISTHQHITVTFFIYLCSFLFIYKDNIH